MTQPVEDPWRPIDDVIEACADALMTAVAASMLPPVTDPQAVLNRAAAELVRVLLRSSSEGPRARDDGLYDAARRATDSALGAGTWAEMNRGNRDPRVQAAIVRAEKLRQIKARVWDECAEAYAARQGTKLAPPSNPYVAD